MMGKPDYTTGDIMKLVNRIMVSEQSATLAERPPSRHGVAPGSPVDMLLKLMDQLSAEDREVFLKELFLLMPPEQRQKGFEYAGRCAQCWLLACRTHTSGPGCVAGAS